MMEYVWSTIDFLVMYLFALCIFQTEETDRKAN